MEEVEIKILEINPTKIRNLVLKNGGKKVKKVFQKNAFYENPITKKKGIAVRIRQENQNFWLTIKSPMQIQNGHKVRKEYEIKIESFEFADQMISLLGLKQIGVGECKREYFKLKNCMVEIIEMPKIPTFLEIEGSEQNILKVAKILGYSEKDYVAENVLDIYKIKTRFLQFK
jgi:adenylate cyclase class 2